MPTVEKSYSLVGNQSTVIPVIVSGGEMPSSRKHNSMMRSEHLFVSGADVFKEDVIVQTTPKELNEIMEKMTKSQATFIFKQTWEAIKAVNTDTAYAERGEAWHNLMTDILLFYVARHKLFGKPWPVVEPPAEWLVGKV